MADPPPRPPPHGQTPRGGGPAGAGAGGKGRNGLPDGNYDIFIVPPHSAGAGFLYLPSMAVQRNSFLAGVACALLAVGLYTVIVPAVKQWLASLMAGGGVGILLIILGVGVAGWAWGKTQVESEGGAGNAGGSAGGNNVPPPKTNGWAPPPPPRPDAKSNPASGWEKAREETRKREEARKREEETKRKADELRKAREDAERASKAKGEKDKWEQARAREKEARELEARERIKKERAAREKDSRGREARENTSSASKPRSSPSKPYRKPTATDYTGSENEYSYRPYDTPKRPGHKSSSSSVISGISDTSFAPSATTARTSPPPSQRGPYHTNDPDKIQIKAVYLFSDSFPLKPLSSLISSQGTVTDGLVLRLKTEGLFIDDDIRGVPQREWDVKAWTLKLVEDGVTKNTAGKGVHVLRATTRDAENRKYVFVLEETEAWKVAVGLARLRKGSQVRALGMSGMKEAEVRGLLGSLGWM